MIRQANKGDLSSIYELVRELAIFEKCENELTATLEDYEKDFEEGVFEALVLEEEGEIRGMMVYYMTYSTWKGKMLYLEDFCVSERYRRFGYGQQLFDAFIAVAKKKECRMVRWQVLDWNDTAVNFYKKNDAVIENDWWMCKIIF